MFNNDVSTALLTHNFQPRQTQPLPNTLFYSRMNVGHIVRTGHDLIAHLERQSPDSDIWNIVRECCK